MQLDYKQIINSLSDIIIVLDSDYHIVFANRTAAEFLGYRPTEITGRKCFTFFHHRSQPCTDASLQGGTCFHREIFTGGTPFTQEHVHPLADGTERTFKINASPIRNEEGDITRALLVLQDISTEKILEKEAKENALEIEMLFNNSPHLLTYITPSLEVAQVNRPMAELAGKSPDQVIGRNYISLWEEDLRENAASGSETGDPSPYPVEKVLREGREYTSVREAGGRIFEIDSVPVRDAAGKITGALEIGRDVTESRRMTEDLRKSEHRYSTLFDNLNDAAFLHDPDGPIMEVNLKARKRLGYTREEFRKMTPADLDAPGYREKVPGRLRQILQKGSLSFETVHVSREGREIPTEVSTKVIDIDGEPAILSLAKDITERKEALAEIQESNARFQSLFENSPIPILLADFSGVKKYLDRLQSETKDVTDLSEYLSLHSNITSTCLRQLRILDINRAAAEMYNLRSKEDFFTELDNLLKQIPLHRNPEGLVAIAEGRTGFSHEMISYTADGNRLHNIVQWAVEPGCEKNYSRVILSILDLTDRKTVEQKLRRDAERLSLLSHIYQALISGSSRDIARTTMERLRYLASFDGAAVMLFHPEERSVERLAMLSTVKTAILNDDSLFLQCRELLDSLKQETIYKYIFRNKDQEKPPPDCLLRNRLHDEDIGYFLSIPMPFREGLTGALILFCNEPGTISADEEKAVREIAYFLAIALQNARLLETITRNQKRMKELHSRLAEAEEAERRRIARELHDEVGQNLTVLGLNLSTLENRLNAKEYQEEDRVRLHDSMQLVQETTEQIRTVMSRLRPPVLDDYGLLASLKWLAARFTSRMAIEISIVGEEPNPQLPPQYEMALFRVVQEGLTNAVKHSQAGQINVSLCNNADHVDLKIVDNGKGFDLDEYMKKRNKEELGLLFMEDRACKCGGTFRIHSAAGRGTAITVKVPYDTNHSC